MNYKIQFRVFINGINYKCLAIDAVESYEVTAGTCNVTLPKTVKVRKGYTVESVNSATLFKRLDKVDVVAGYQKSLWTVFTGYVDFIKPGGSGLELLCKNEAICLELFTVKKAWSNVSVSQIIAEIKAQSKGKWFFSDVKLHTDFTYQKFTLASARGNKVLDRLREDGADSWVRDGILHIGLQVVPALQKIHKLDFSVHITSESGLEYQDTVPDLYVKGTSNTSGKKLEYSFGVEGAKEIKVNRHNLSYEALKKLVHSIYDRNPAAGYTGNFEMFGFPQIRQGDAIQLIDPANQDRDTDYYLVKSVRTSCSADNGLRQQIELAGKRI